MAEKKKSRSEQPNHLKVWMAFGIIAVLAIAGISELAEDVRGPAESTVSHRRGHDQ